MYLRRRQRKRRRRKPNFKRKRKQKKKGNARRKRRKTNASFKRLRKRQRRGKHVRKRRGGNLRLWKPLLRLKKSRRPQDRKKLKGLRKISRKPNKKLRNWPCWHKLKLRSKLPPRSFKCSNSKTKRARKFQPELKLRKRRVRTTLLSLNKRRGIRRRRRGTRRKDECVPDSRKLYKPKPT